MLAGAALLTCLGGCATVSVYEPATTTEISLEGPGAELQRAARAYCDTAKGKGLAAGETSLKTLSETVFGAGPQAQPYWARINAELGAPADVVRVFRADAAEVTAGLAALNAQAAALIKSTKPSKDDVGEFERVLIHARQARDSLAAAGARLSPRLSASQSGPLSVDQELRDLDRAISRAQTLADDLSAARMAEPLAATGPIAPRA